MSTHSHEILFTTHTYLTFTFSLINTDSRNGVEPWIHIRVELFTRPFLPSPLLPQMVKSLLKCLQPEMLALLLTGR